MRFSEDKLSTFLCSDYVKRTIHIWEPKHPKMVILGLHGGTAHAGDFVVPALYFRRLGIATVSFDMCGHCNKRVDIPNFDVFLKDAALFLKWVQRNYPGLPIFVMGHSMGALIATHMELGPFGKEAGIKGLILSSPYYVNAIKVPKILEMLSQPLARLTPRMKVPIEYLTPYVTHDATITERHIADEQDNIRATEVSMRFAASLLAAQLKLRNKLGGWTHPVFVALAGDDRLADTAAAQSMLQDIPAGLLECHLYPKNYHENFNELNRNQIFASILAWMHKQLDRP